MSNHSDEKHIEDEELNEETGISERDKRIFINQVDLYHGKNIARVSKFY